MVSLTFWGSFCHSCRHREAKLDGFANSLTGKAAVTAINASADETADEDSASAKSKGLTLPIFFDGKGEADPAQALRRTSSRVVHAG